MEIPTTGNTLMDLLRDSGRMSGEIVQSTRGTSNKATKMDMEFGPETGNRNTKGTISWTGSMGMGYTRRKMGEFTREIIFRTHGLGKGSFILMGTSFTAGFGKMASNYSILVLKTQSARL